MFAGGGVGRFDQVHDIIEPGQTLGGQNAIVPELLKQMGWDHFGSKSQGYGIDHGGKGFKMIMPLKGGLHGIP
jgi:hypothetical protein